MWFCDSNFNTKWCRKLTGRGETTAFTLTSDVVSSLPSVFCVKMHVLWKDECESHRDKKRGCKDLKKSIHDGLSRSDPDTTPTHHQIEKKLHRMIAVRTIQCPVKFWGKGACRR
jgi:hypothetical protein